ncbi:MAG: hypothetical protein H7Y00_13500, partial [Fimbriimonadaceae bacterium]|nr:hypothetical protein [Chitinophagales bacterium]
MNSKAITLFILTIINNLLNAQAPHWSWIETGQVDNYAQPYTVTADLDANIFISGLYMGDLTLGLTTLTSEFDFDPFFAKFDSAGNVIWAKDASCTGYSACNSTITDEAGNVYLTVFFENTISFDGTELTSVGEFDFALIKYNSGGDLQWANQIGGDSLDISHNLIIDANGDIVLTGQYVSDELTFDSYTITKQGSSDIFIAKYDTDGNAIWAKSAGGDDWDFSYAISGDADGNIFITGGFISPTLPFGSTDLINKGYIDMFIAKYDASGNPLWANSGGGISY